MAKVKVKVSSLLDKDIHKRLKQLQLDKDFRSISEAIRYVMAKAKVK